MYKLNLIYNKNIPKLVVFTFLVIAASLLSYSGFAQEIEKEPNKISVTVVGKVFDIDGEPLVGVLINISEKNVITFSDQQGDFSITAFADDELIFTLDGFQNVTAKVNTEEPMVITMLSGKGEQGDIVELPYHTSLREQVLASTSTAKGRVLEKLPVTFTELALAGTMTGLTVRERQSEPGWNYYLDTYLRGVRTFGTQAGNTGFGDETDGGNPNRPLYIIDNIERDFNTMDAYTIEDITVLKDLAATAIYGQRGANGVILITTRRGEAGRTRINWNQEFGFQSILKMPHWENSAEYAETMNRAAQLDGSAALPYTQQDIDLYRSGASPWTHPNTDWYDMVIADYAPQNRTNINISGGNQTARFFVSISNTTQEALYDDKWTHWNDQFNTEHKLNRWNLRSNIDVNINKNLNVSLDLGGRLDVINQPSTLSGAGTWAIFTWATENHPNWLAINPNGSWAGGDGPWTQADRNPLAKLAEYGYEENTKRSIYTNVRANYKLDFITPGLSTKVLVAFDSFNSFWIERGMRPGIYKWNATDSSYTEVGAPVPLTLNRSQARDMVFKTDINFTVDYHRMFGKHDIYALALYRQDVKNKVGITARWSNIAFAGKVNYAFDNKYLLEASITRMGMDNYIKGERFGTFPGISAGYILSNEDFLKDSKAISQIKLRGSWGMAGNERTRARRYPYTDIYTSGTGYTFGGLNNVNYPGYVESEAGNKLIKWETSAMTNLGLDLSFWNNALYATIDVFKEHRWGILTNRNTIPLLYGQTPPLDSYGEVSNKGGEILIGTDLKAGDFHFNVSVSGSAAFNKILEMDEVTPPEEYQVLTGRPIGQVLGYKFVKFFDSYEEIANSPVQELGTANLKPGNIKWADLNGDNLVNVNDRTYIGNVDIPKFVMGSNIRISYKGFEIYALLYGEFQRSVVVGVDLVAHGLQWSGKTTPEVRKSWGYYSLDPTDPTNINAKYPRISADNGRYANDHQYTSNTTNIQYESDKWFVNGDFIRLRNIEFAYTIPTKLTEKLRISNLRLFVNGYNLFVWDHIKLLDPETTANFLWGYPKTKAINFGFNVTF